MQLYYENQTMDYIHCRDSRFTKVATTCSSHLHYHIELAFFLKGKTMAVVDSQEYELCGGDILISFPNQIHRFEALERENYVLLLISPELIPELSGQFTGALPASNALYGMARDPELKGLIYKISDTYHGTEPFRESIIRGYLLVFFSKLLQRMELRDTKSQDYHVLDAVLNYCIQHYDKNLSLEFLEKELHISKYYNFLSHKGFQPTFDASKTL